MNPLDALRHHVTGAIERGEKQAITEQCDMAFLKAGLVHAEYMAKDFLNNSCAQMDYWSKRADKLRAEIANIEGSK